MSRILRKRAFVGMSGGVDSSVSAALLKEQGYEVTGVFIKVWQPSDGSPRAGSGQLQATCNWKEDRLDAMRVCAKLGIPFVTLDLSAEYKKEVVDYMIAEYKAGRTPNPDVMCNRHVKFGGFYEWAMNQGADYVATGHYARVKKLKAKSYKLKAGSDPQKDQSYFLWTLKQEQLAHTLFPVGGLKKPEVRQLAKKFGLPTADKKDSQGLCFLGKIDIKEFLKTHIKPKKGNALNEKGEVVGEHDGVALFTLGERHGFRITQKTANDKPFYVVGKDIKKNTLVVSDDISASVGAVSRHDFELESVNWIGPAPAAGAGLSARIRYRQPLKKIRVVIRDSKFVIRFQEIQTGASGQSIVLYDGAVCLGGGVIK